MKIKLSIISCLLLRNTLLANDMNLDNSNNIITHSIEEIPEMNEITEVIPQLEQNKYEKTKRKDLFIELFEDKNEDNLKLVKEAFNGYIPTNKSRIINTDKVEILYSNIGKKVITKEDYNNVRRNIGKPLFINGLYFGTIKSIKLNENNNLEYSLENDTNLDSIYQTDSTNKYWEDDFNISEAYIKNLKYKEKKFKWNNVLDGYYPLEGSRFISDKKQKILEQTDTLLITDEVILPHEANINKGKPLFINGIYKGIILIMMSYSGDKTMYVIKTADSLSEIYEKTPEFKKINKSNISRNLRVNKLLSKKEVEDYKNLQIKNVQEIHFSVLSSTLGFIPEIGSRFISTKFTNVNSIEKIGDITFVITNENDGSNFNDNKGKPLFIDGIYQGIIEDILTSNNSEMIYKLKNIQNSNSNILFKKNKTTNFDNNEKIVTEEVYLYK